MAKFFSFVNLCLLGTLVGLLLATSWAYLELSNAERASCLAKEDLSAAQVEFLDTADEWLQLSRDRADLRLILKQHDNHVDLED